MGQKEIIVDGYKHIRYQAEKLNPQEMIRCSEEFYKHLNNRRSVRHFSDKKVPKSIIENIIKTAGTAPSGAHKQPWKFCVVSNAEMKAKIRKAAEIEEKENYTTRMSERWLKDLAPLGTNDNKDFLEIAPYLVVVFKEVFELDEDGSKHTNYYVNESVGIACGMFITAIHNAGLVTLTHTPSPMNFLTNLLKRPANERAFLLLPVGYPADRVFVPDITRKELREIAEFYI